MITLLTRGPGPGAAARRAGEEGPSAGPRTVRRPGVDPAWTPPVRPSAHPRYLKYGKPHPRPTSMPAVTHMEGAELSTQLFWAVLVFGLPLVLAVVSVYVGGLLLFWGLLGSLTLFGVLLPLSLTLGR